MKHLLLSVGLAVCPALALTQQPLPANLSLADALALAHAHNPLYRQVLHDRGPAGWAARNAWSSTFLPTLTASGGVGYAGSGQQRFLTANFSQNVSTLSSSYGLFLDWALNGQTITQIPLKHAQLSAADADVAGAESDLITGVTQQYLSVLQARDNADVARKELDRNEQFLKLAQARYDVGRASLIDVRQAQVARGQAEVALLRAETGLQLEKLRLFQQIGVTPPTDIATVQLTDTFAVQTPAWQLGDLLTMAEGQNPALKAIRDQNAAYPFNFTPQPFQARLTVSIPLWGNFSQPLQVSQAKAQQQDLEESVRARGLQVHTEVSQAYLTVTTAYRTIAIQDTNRTAAREQLQLATERYRVGSGTFFELLDAQVAALRAESEYVNAVYDYHKAVAALEAAVGRPLR